MCTNICTESISKTNSSYSIEEQMRERFTKKDKNPVLLLHIIENGNPHLFIVYFIHFLFLCIPIPTISSSNKRTLQQCLEKLLSIYDLFWRRYNLPSHCLPVMKLTPSWPAWLWYSAVGNTYLHKHCWRSHDLATLWAGTTWWVELYAFF